jgi:6-phosphogluconolactonase (cycloisomerase 2 family)
LKLRRRLLQGRSWNTAKVPEVVIAGYGIDATTGMLSVLLGFAVATGANAYSVTVDPIHQFLYVANDGATNVSGFSLDSSTGLLTPIAGSPFAAGNRPDFVAAF